MLFPPPSSLSCSLLWTQFRDLLLATSQARGGPERGWQLQQINVKGLTFSFIGLSKQPLQGEGGGLLSSCLSGCHLCFNLLLYFSKPNRETLGCRFMLHFPFSPIAPSPFSASSVKKSVHEVAQLHMEGLLSLVGCLVATLPHSLQAAWLFLCTFSSPYAVMLSWLRLKRQVAKVKVFVVLSGKDGEQVRNPVTHCGRDSSIPASQVLESLE